MKPNVKRSVCPYDCPDTCGLLVEIVNGKAISVKGDPNHPFTRGKLCPKMQDYPATVYSSKRLTKPLLRSGPKGTNQFQEVSWDEALKLIKSKWTHLMDLYGAESILPYSYAGTMGLIQRNYGDAFFNYLGSSRLERTICSSTKGHGWSTVMGSTLAPHPDEALASDLIILWGTNALATNVHFLHNVKEAKKQGTKVWLIETYETPTAKVADKLITIQPGSDGALALGMMHVLVRDQLINESFINQYVEGFQRFNEEILLSYTPEYVSNITGIAPELIERLAHLYAQAKAPYISLGSGLSRYGNGAMTVRCITCLPALVGAWAKQGGGLFANISTASAFNMSKVTRGDFLKTQTRTINMNQLGNVLTNLENPPIMSLYVYQSNPAAIAPDQNMVIKGLMREDLFTVVHERFLTDTVSYADIVLPATTSLEHSDIYRSFGHYCIQRAYPLIEPLGEAKSNFEVFKLLAETMDFNEAFFTKSTDELIDELIQDPNSWLASIDFDALKAGYPVELPLPHDYKLKFNTPSGKIELLNSREAEPLPRYLEPHGDNGPYWFVNGPSLYSLNSSFNEQAELVKKKGKMSLMMNPQDALDKGLSEGELVTAFNHRGEVNFILKISEKIPKGVVVSEGIFWLQDCPGNRSVNALTSQRLTDRASGSTFYDTKVEVKRSS
ncbi:MAG: molybdopterin oxidoreductase family protein [Bacillota bacterium]|nr:molybdopterin oxidoreductase family protein [Bacillota bacterium]